MSSNNSCYLLNIKNDKIENIDCTDALNKLYYLEYTVPDKNQLIDFADKHIDVNTIIKNNKINLSKIEDSIPLYDIYTDNIYLIGKYNVYDRVMHQNYRFPSDDILDELKIKLKALEKKDSKDKLLLRQIKKINMMLNFMNCFDLDILHDTYIKIFYKYSNLAGKNTTNCMNQSFLPQVYHISPYLTRSEVINSALNYGIEVPDKILESNEINSLCKQIKKYQFTSDILLKHQRYIIKSGFLGLVQYYTLQGSFFMNQYLRNLASYSGKNIYLEQLIQPMWNLVLDAPEFDKSYTLYRFVQRDDYLQYLKIGDVYIEEGFLSTTRDQFYKADEYGFGFILIKINIPKNTKGVALCLEFVSHFPHEQEFIFPPKSHFKLIAKDFNCDYYHTNPHFISKVKTRYEFEWIENESISFNKKSISKSLQTINFLEIKKSKSFTLAEKIKYFEDNFVNEMFQFKIIIGNKELVLMTEHFNSTDIYKKYYAIESKNGFAIYTIYKNFILFFIEIGEMNGENEIHINYYTKYSMIDPSKEIGDEELVTLFSSIAYFFDISNVILYGNYLSCNLYDVGSTGNKNIQFTHVQSGGKHNKIKQRGFSHNKQMVEIDINENLELKTQNVDFLIGSYNVDIYQYLTTGIKKYSDIGILNLELQPKFSYYDLDILKQIPPNKILKKEDGEIYQLYDKIFDKKNNNIADFFIWLKHNKCYLIDNFVSKIDIVLKSNPFKNDYYVLDSSTYLYNRKYISTYPTTTNIRQNIKRNILKDNKNDYRTRQSTNS